MTDQVRAATQADLDAIVALASAKRRQYSGYQPVYWAPAPDAEKKQGPYLAKLIGKEDVITLVSESSGVVTGFVVGFMGDAPAVYDPGGRTCQIDDFVVEPGRWGSAGAQLLRAATEQAKDRGAIQVVVVAGHLDEEKREALLACGLSIASEWWVTPALTGPELGSQS
ncbi:MAG TPA: GNAT family N-acetyltransferase [Streptosporangiaceae bacterium]|nr:GNAT family N-acetyltransferase [Streptosporangiaceae bacterium]